MEILIILILIAAAYVCIAVRHDTHTFVVRSYDISSPKIRHATSFCLLADLHEKDYGQDNRLLTETIKSLKPGFILSAGDLLTAHYNAAQCYSGATIRLLRALTGVCPVYAGSGNHETKLSAKPERYGTFFREYERELEVSGVHVLHHAPPFSLTEDIDLAALELDLSYYTHGRQKKLSAAEITDVIGMPDEERFTILIAHEPGRFRAYGEWGADLTLSGHVHGGVARVPYRGVISPSLHFLPFYDGGAFLRRTDPREPGKAPEESHMHFGVRHPDGQMLYLKENLHAMIVSRGLGTHTINVRFNNPGELVFVRLHPADAPDASQ